MGAMAPSVLFTFAFADGIATGLKNSDGVGWLAEQIIIGGGGRDSPQPLLIMCLLFTVLSFVTNFINNNTTCMLFLDVALEVATIAKIPPKPMIALVVFGSTAAFCTPIGTSCNMLVAGPGKYSFMDFVKTGACLQVVTLIASVSVIYVWAEMLKGGEQ